MSKNVSDGLIIANPAAGRGRGLPRLRAAVAGTSLAAWPLIETDGPWDAFKIARLNADKGGIVAAAGGDGTVSEVAAGLAESPSALAVLPIGTGNDFARSLGLGGYLSKAIETIERNEQRPVDMMNWRTGEEGGLGINVSGCGFDAVVAKRINEGFRYLRGTTAYVAAVVSSLRSYRPSSLRLDVDGETLETTVMLCAVANATSYGGGMLVAPNADMCDGLLDVVLVEGLSRAAFLAAFPRVFKGTHVTHPRVKTLRGRSARIDASPTLPVLCDGELVGNSPVEFSIVPKAIRVVVPR